VLPYLATLASGFSVFYSIRFIHKTFFGPAPVDFPHAPHEAPPWIRLPIEILVCQTAFKRDPRSASKRDPLFG
jgi:multicomponent K+:H+ antiporter subunit A